MNQFDGVHSRQIAETAKIEKRFLLFSDSNSPKSYFGGMANASCACRGRNWIKLLYSEGIFSILVGENIIVLRRDMDGI